MRERKIFSDSDPDDEGNASPKEIATRLGQLERDECWTKNFLLQRNSHDNRVMVSFITSLQENGLDIGRGDAQFGFRMPLPEKGATFRKLQIFRRS